MIDKHPVAEERAVLKPYSIEARSLIEGAIYEHYRGNRYQLLAIARNSESLEECVVYRALYGDCEVWVRPLQMFLETVTVNGETVPRFKFLGGR